MKYMCVRIGNLTTTLLTLFFCASGYTSDIVFVVANMDSRLDYMPRDIHGVEQSIRTYQSWLRENGYPDVVVKPLHIDDLSELRPILREHLDGHDRLAGLFFEGHGNAVDFQLNKHQYYVGRQMAAAVNRVFASSVITTDHVVIYLGACLNACTLTNGQNLFREFMENLDSRGRKVTAFSHKVYAEGARRIKGALGEPLHRLEVGSILSTVEQKKRKWTSNFSAAAKTAIDVSILAGPVIVSTAYNVVPAFDAPAWTIFIGYAMSATLFYINRKMYTVVEMAFYEPASRSNARSVVYKETSLSSAFKKSFSAFSCKNLFSH